MITYNQAVDEISQIVHENYGHVYKRPPSAKTCLYAHWVEGELVPGCLLGRWLHRFHGVSLQTLACFEMSVGAVLLRLGWSVDADARVFLHSIQKTQDEGHPWNESLVLYAKECVRYQKARDGRAPTPVMK